MPQHLKYVYIIIGTTRDGAQTMLKAFTDEEKAVQYLDKITHVRYDDVTGDRILAPCEILGITCHMDIRVIEE